MCGKGGGAAEGQADGREVRQHMVWLIVWKWGEKMGGGEEKPDGLGVESLRDGGGNTETVGREASTCVCVERGSAEDGGAIDNAKMNKAGTIKDKGGDGVREGSGRGGA